MGRFVDIAVFRAHRFSLGRDAETGALYLSTPVSGFNRAAEYEAYFRISAEAFEQFRADPDTAEAFLEACRNHEHEDRRLA
ncbi:hypothetical protein WMC41_26295 (plasmid) [Shinella yambaruensis]|uniref:hypothetical protein n=1 Tax=Shinella yambaruensis TaxID=415996 RepID=UPI003D7BE31A